MPYRVCPSCRKVGRLLPFSTSEYVEYYRCDDCGHVWVRDKDKPNDKPRDVTIDATQTRSK
jgi:uncharacterized Zn finger protein